MFGGPISQVLKLGHWILGPKPLLLKKETGSWEVSSQVCVLDQAGVYVLAFPPHRWRCFLTPHVYELLSPLLGFFWEELLSAPLWIWGSQGVVMSGASYVATIYWRPLPFYFLKTHVIYLWPYREVLVGQHFPPTAITSLTLAGIRLTGSLFINSDNFKWIYISSNKNFN